MSFLLYDLSFLVLFSIAIALFLYKHKKGLTKDGWMYLYKTQIGMRVIDYLGTKNKKLLKFSSYVIVATGYLLMAVMIWLLYNTVKIFFNPQFVQIIKIPPLMPLIPYLPGIFQIIWLPPFYFTYWIVAIALIALFHEGFHGIFAKFNNVRIKSTGFGFLGPFLAFFVEQDDKQMQKKKIFPQLTILGAGVFANILLGIIFLIVMIGFFSLAYTPAGVNFNTYAYDIAPLGSIGFTNISLTTPLGNNYTQVVYNNQAYLINQGLVNKTLMDNETQMIIYQIQPAITNDLRGSITQINDESITKNSDINQALSSFKPGDSITVKTRYQNGTGFQTLTFNLKLGADYTNLTRPVIGIGSAQYSSSGLRGFLNKMFYAFRDPTIDYEPKANPEFTLFIYNLLWWIVLINFSVALTNMLPMGIFDGGRFFYLTVFGITGSKKIAEKSFKWATKILLLILLLLMLLWVRGIFFKF